MHVSTNIQQGFEECLFRLAKTYGMLHLVSHTVDLASVKAGFYAMGHIPHAIGAIDGTHIALIPPRADEQMCRNRKSFHSINVQMVCLADQYTSQVSARFPGSVYDLYNLRNRSVPWLMALRQRVRAYLMGDSRYPSLSWLLTPVRNPRTRTEEQYNETHGSTGRVIKRIFVLLKARFRCLHISGGYLQYSPQKMCQIVLACCMLSNLALRRNIPLLEEEGVRDNPVAEEAGNMIDENGDEEDVGTGTELIQQYFS
ncbi:putative nuclease HARBI1 [Pleurodeles waltl]|uniref:putative nuclease HARBI1 n=1 Tax=Pleurodeles waltl TaxID=8319 RepID=UPI0037095B0E